MTKKPPQHPRKRACAKCAHKAKIITLWQREFQEFRVQAAENLEQAMSERDHYRILRDAASEASLRREADCLAIRTERDKVIDEMNNLIVKYNLPVLLRGSCGRRVL